MAKEEEDMYGRFVTPEIEDLILNVYKMKINRGIHPPKIEGCFKLLLLCQSSNVPNDNQPRNIINYCIRKLYNQRYLYVDLKTIEVRTNNVFVGEGTFISGEGDNFTVYLEQEIVYTGNRNHTLLGVVSGTIDRDNSGKNIGIKDYQYALIMKENNEHSGLIPNNTGRMFIDNEGYAEAITEEEFASYEKLGGKAAVSSFSADNLFGVASK